MGSKDNKQWIRLALDANTREIVGVYIGERNRASAKKLWQSLPPVYPRVFGGKIPPETLDASVRCVTPTFGRRMSRCYPVNDIRRSARRPARTSYIERFNNTLRQRVGRLVRKTLSFSKKLSNSLWSNLAFCSLLQCLATLLTITMHDYPHNYSVAMAMLHYTRRHHA